MKPGVLVLAVLLSASGIAAGQTPLEMKVDMRSPTAAAPRELVVDDWSRVRVSVTKNMFHTCRVETKTEVLPAPPNPVAQILAALGPFIGGAPAFAPEARLAKTGLEAQIAALVTDAGAVLAKLKEQALEVQKLAGSLAGRVACDPSAAANDVCVNADAAQARLDTIAEDIMATPREPVVSIALLSARAAELSKILISGMGKAEDETSLSSAFEGLRRAQEIIDYASGRREAVIEARNGLQAIRDRVLGFAPSMQAIYPLSPVRNSRTVATVSCVNVVTQEPVIYTKSAGSGGDSGLRTESLAPVSGSVVFRAVPWATVSGGLLYSLVDKREIGVEVNKTGNDAAGVATFDRRVRETDGGASQVVPFTYFNLLLPGLAHHAAYVAASVGFGLNPNNGPKTQEYFVGAAIGIGRFVVLNAGVHLGSRLEPDNGFQIGDVVPSGLTTIPTRRERSHGLALGVSYGLPLPK
jgi:hypothetical protein